MDDEDVEEALLALKEIEEKGSIPFDEMLKRCRCQSPKGTEGQSLIS